MSMWLNDHTQVRKWVNGCTCDLISECMCDSEGVSVCEWEWR